MAIFLGKFSNKYPEQIEKKFCSAGEEGNSYYGGVKPGDYVFVAYEGRILALWKAKEYTKLDNTVNPKKEGVLLFEELKTYNDISVTNDFTRYKYFIHDLNLVNKATKSVKGLGFIPIETAEECPPNPVDIDFKSSSVSIYIALKDANVIYKEGDIRVTINNIDQMKIASIDRFDSGKFVVYDSLNRLYDERNAEDGKYTIRELSDYALEDQASQKRKFLITLIEELESNGYYKVSSPIRLYDNLLVGRKRTANTSTGKNSIPKEGTGDEPAEDDNEEYEMYAGLLNFNPNLILYGPPGTGKTYATKRIIDSFEKKHFKAESSYRVAEIENRVKTITFHQSYSYEEFIEGIRPVMNEDDDSKVGYRLENGLFKELCINAEKELIKRQNNAEYVDMINSESSIWKVSLGERKSDDVFDECIRSGDIAVNWLDKLDLSNMTYDDLLAKLGNVSAFGNKPTQDANSLNSFVNEMTIGDIVLVYDSPQTIRMIGVINSDYRYDNRYMYKHRRSVKWLEELSYPINVHKYNKHKNLTLKTIYKLSRISVPDIIEMVTQNSMKKQSHEDKQAIRPYYMIIDEINRGNIAKIFGELITLVEQDKRGSQKSLLPYSKKEFSVPSNLFIIGTMNTADRSIAAIDTALRRRFTFVEIEPDSGVLLLDNPIVNDSIDLTKLLDAVNQRIMDKYDRDHRIGHAYFMGIESLSNLYQTWYYKVLPLLGEYFYNDTETLKSIVGKSFYDAYGNVKFLSLNRRDNLKSEFEEKIMEIYMVNDNG